MPDGTMQVETRSTEEGRDERFQYSVLVRLKSS
jgi:hypothetical protein